jgi:hypothetical protein
MTRNFFVGGVVRGSVSMTNAKKRRDEEVIVLSMTVSMFTPVLVMSRERTMETSAVAKKLNTKSKRIIFRVRRSPPMRTNGAMAIVPTHQLAERPKKSDVRNTAIAAGLKRCFLFMANIYFVAMDHTAAHPASIKKEPSVNEFGGVMINTKMSAVM